VGGAKATRRGRPWKILAYISGFISRQEALKFEWRVHHPGMSWRGLLGRKKVLAKIITEEKWKLGDIGNHRILIITWLNDPEKKHNLELLDEVRNRCLEQNN
jgi:hypothetical protein